MARHRVPINDYSPAKVEGLKKRAAAPEKAPPPLTFKRLQDLNKVRNQTEFPECFTWQGTDWGCALSGEVGELCNILKKIRRGDFTTLTYMGKPGE